MKKAMCLLLVVVIVCSLSACGGNSQKALHEATELNFIQLLNDLRDNHLVAEEEYSEKLYKIYGGIYEIDRDSAIVMSGNSDLLFDVELSTKLLKSINQGEYVTVVGKITAVEKDDEGDFIVKVKNVKYLSNITEVTGFVREISENAFYIYENGKRVEVIYFNRDIPEDMNKVVRPGISFTVNGEVFKEGDRIIMMYIKRCYNENSTVKSIGKF